MYTHLSEYAGTGARALTSLECLKGANLVHFDLEVCIRSTELPALHADPCDRMMIAAAQVHHMPVVTTDPIFAQYGIEIMS